MFWQERSLVFIIVVIFEARVEKERGEDEKHDIVKEEYEPWQFWQEKSVLIL